MKTIKIISTMLLFGNLLFAQEHEIIPDLTQLRDSTIWHLSDREILNDNPVHLSKGEGDGMVWLKNINFRNGKIDLDIRGRDQRGESFVGLAFHGQDRNNFDLVYFRPFNFKSTEKSENSVQYVSQPEFTWRKLREEHPGVYESAPTPIPDPTNWFHVTIIIDYPSIQVFVNNSEVPSLSVEQLSKHKEGWLGFWVGSFSEGEFKNLKITKD